MNGKSTAGFTLLELVAVLVLLGLLASQATLHYSRGGSTLQAQAEQVAADLLHAQGLAMQLASRVRFEATGAGYQVVDEASNTPLNDPATGQAFIVALENGVSLGGGPVRFDSLGRPSSGTGLLNGPVDFLLQADGRTRTVRVTPLSGLAEVLP